MPRMRRRTLIVLLIFGGLGLAGYALYVGVWNTINDAYAVWHVAGRINDYMDAHGGAWPHGWEDLRTLDPDAREYWEGYWPNLEARVNVDWSADPAILALTPQPMNDNPPFQAVWLRNGKKTHWAGTEPNALIWEHLHAPGTRPATSPSPTGAASPGT